ncbi:anaerobic dimethyl sulfoxide reductase subunit B (iron-sulfur subunit) [Desulfitobacterium sp. LBE]|uniref:4Fe-4S ferredoxin n=3 Tax=Desulfitobacterium hafniense TaxID=49338 RepID=A0A098B7T6_DESHA|nr:MULTISPECIES: 4Fe-4S dicluster domain-containing protein [Desulfitobacterium]ACL22694.1 dimethylsulfoxide reductase, chain B [Desulfitobacterium hafniense DCB-2]KTE93643.1 4Fe-4S ferredoxin [Desulfitobacterium hafniense]TWH59399.1 anaerobic dimethyl sulfoxide reductase subunit B (iron-sulfur subunit) [Desulfitobacterium sp. LBE]CDX04933.1 Molybdopterin oxidoreductase, chain B [Desulfitobacterium hafniense]BAE86612.1 putative anaerobic DMSO reductase chain B iron-sulfur subunit [Desulfitobac
MGQLGFYYDMTTCMGCKACQIACKDRNDLKVGELFRRVYEFEGGIYPQVGGYYLSMGCNHCADAKCVKGCPTGAMHVAADGTVQHDQELCIGCKYCVWNCPYSVPHYFEDKSVVGKCDSCKELRDAGQNPVCVDACIMRCLKFGDLDQLKGEYGTDLVQELPILPAASQTNPSLLIQPKDEALKPDYKKVGV